MTAVSASVLKGYFTETDAPTCAQFSDLIDSLFARGSAAGTAQGLESLGAGTVGAIIVQSNTTASVQSGLGFGTVGGILVNQGTTASAQSVIGGGTVGRIIFSAGTTASAQTDMGGGSIGRQIFEATTTASVAGFIAPSQAGTTAQAAAGLNNSAAFVTPDTLRFNPYAIRAYATFNSAGTLLVSKRVSSVAHNATGDYTIKWAPALPTAAYVMTLACDGGGVNSDKMMNIEVSGGLPNASAASISFYNNGGTLGDPQSRACVAVMCSGI